MQIFHNRPFALACCSFVLTALVIFLSNAVICWIVIAVCTVGAILTYTLYFRHRIRAMLLVGMCFLLALLAAISSGFYFYVRLASYSELVGNECTVEGTILERTSDQAFASSFKVHLEKLNGVPCWDDVRIKCTYASALQAGDRFSMTAEASDFEAGGTYEEQLYAIPDGILGVFVCTTPDNCTIFPEKSRSWRVLFPQWNRNVSERLTEIVGGEEGNLAVALLLGNREALSEDSRLAFSRSGVSHLLALSGLHVSILMGGLEWLLRRFACPKKVRAVFIIGIAFGYLFLTGGSLSTVRAVLMLSTLQFGFLLRAEYDPLTSLFLSLTVILMITPCAIADTGMWMSFIAAGSIVTFLPPFLDKLQNWMQTHIVPLPLRRLLSSFCSALFVGCIVNLAMLAIQSYVFGNVSLLSVLTTMLLSVPLTLTLIFAIVSLFLPIFGPCCACMAWLMLRITERISAMDGILLSVKDPLSQGFILLVTVVLLLIALLKLKHPLRWCALPLAVVLLFIPVLQVRDAFAEKELRIEYVLGSAGDMLVFSQAGKTVAVDFSDGSGAYTMLEAIERANAVQLDDLILSHYHHKDAYLISRLSANIRIRCLHLPVPLNDWETSVSERLSEEAELHGITVRFDLEALAIDALKIDVAEHSLFSSDRHCALLFSATAYGERVTYVNCSLPDSPLRECAEEWILKTNTLIIGDTGASVQSDARFSNLSNSVQTVLISSERFDLLPQALPAETSVIKDCSNYSYIVKSRSLVSEDDFFSYAVIGSVFFGFERREITFSMLTDISHVSFAILGGDRRQLAVAETLASYGCSVRTWGVLNADGFDADACVSECSDWIHAVIDANAVVLPLPATLDGVRINCPRFDGDEGLRLDILLKQLSGKLLIGGKLSEQIHNLADDSGVLCMDYFASELLQLKNALPSAEGAIELAMRELPITIDGMHAVVVGYGRIGSLLAQKLNALGANVSVFARRTEVLTQIELAHLHPIKLERRHDHSSLARIEKRVQAIFNTVPEVLFTKEVLQNLPHGCIVIDLASSPGGVDRSAAEKLGIKTIWATGLPGKYAPKTAGIIIAETIRSMLSECGFF